MKDIVKFRNIADYLLESGNYPKAYETYFMVYSEIWVALSKFRNTIISRDAFKNGQSDEVIELIKYGKLHQVFFERFKLGVEQVFDEFIFTINGRIKCLALSQSLHDKSSLALIYNEFLLLYLFLLYPDEIICIQKIFEFFHPVSRGEKLSTIKLLISLKEVENKLLEKAETVKKKETNFINIILMQIMTDAGATDTIGFRNLNKLEKDFNPGQRLKKKEFKEFENFLIDKRKKFNPFTSSEKEKAVFYGKILGLVGKIKKTEIHERYKQKMLMYHPDKLRNNNPELHKLIETKTKEINEAYDWFKQKYKL